MPFHQQKLNMHFINTKFFYYQTNYRQYDILKIIKIKSIFNMLGTSYFKHHTLQTPKYSQKMLKPQIDYKFLEYHMIPNSQDFQYVYRPADDSFLLLSVLYNQLILQPTHHLISLNPTICQVGSGSGIISSHIHQWLKDINRKPLIHISTDINPDACMLSAKYYLEYKLDIDSIHTSLMKNLKTPKNKNENNDIYAFKPQIIVCNPPYIPTEEEETNSQKLYLQNRLKVFDCDRKFENNMISYSWMGGCDGLQTTRKLLATILWNCVVYLIVMGEDYVIKLVKQLSTHSILNQSYQCQVDVLQRNKKYNQQLYVIRIIITKL